MLLMSGPTPEVRLEGAQSGTNTSLTRAFLFADLRDYTPLRRGARRSRRG